MKIVRVTSTQDYFAEGKEELVLLLYWLESFPLPSSPILNLRVGFSHHLVEYEVLTPEEAYPQEDE